MSCFALAAIFTCYCIYLFYNAFVRPHLVYSALVWGDKSLVAFATIISKLQDRILRIIFNADIITNTARCYENINNFPEKPWPFKS